METTFCLTSKALNWLIFKCEDYVSLTHFEEYWDGCPWIPVSALLDYMTQETLNKLTSSVRTFILEDTQEFDAKHLITA